jgi:hypothetical protein
MSLEIPDCPILGDHHSCQECGDRQVCDQFLSTVYDEINLKNEEEQ